MSRQSPLVIFDVLRHCEFNEAVLLERDWEVCNCQHPDRKCTNLLDAWCDRDASAAEGRGFISIRLENDVFTVRYHIRRKLLIVIQCQFESTPSTIKDWVLEASTADFNLRISPVLFS